MKKTLERLQKIKEESYEKMSRRVVFTDLDTLGFDENSTRVPVTELHLDQDQIIQQQAKKEEVVERQAEQKKKNKKKKNKGLKEFMEKEDDYDSYNRVD